MPVPLRIATRGSALARWQAEWVARLLRDTSQDRDVTLVPISTTGDRRTDAPLARLEAQGVFTREIQQAVLDGRADVAVHSLKDLPTGPVTGLALVAVPPRAPVEDVLVLPARGMEGRGRRAEGQEPTARDAAPFAALHAGAIIGTGSLRRRAQLLWARRDLVTQDVRGNVETRLRKLDEGRYDALVLARAGLERLGLQERISQVLPTDVMLPAVGQGAVGVECRHDDHATRRWLDNINHPPTRACVLAERALLAALRGGCQAPIGALARMQSEQLHLQAVVLSPDGTRRLAADDLIGDPTPIDEAATTQDIAKALGKRVAEVLLRERADDLIARARRGDQ